MSGDGGVTFDWAGEERTFRYRLGEIKRLQTATNAGPQELLRRFTTGTWRIDDLRETIRLGLEGAGVSASEAGRLLRDYVDPPKPLLDSVLVAARILEGLLAGVPDDPIPKSEAAENADPSSRTESSPSPPSTPGPQSSE